ncbi:MAG: polyprenol monophosphomannose synthase, partial [Planctomycetota bacterium]
MYPSHTPKISIVIPTYKEKANLPVLVERIYKALVPLSTAFEMIVVDDNSPDGTFQIAQELAKQYPLRPFIRKEEKGLSSAMWFGFQKALGDIVGFIDADLQHPPEVIPQLVQPILEGKAMMTVGSRLVEGGGVEDWPWYRRWVSSAGRLLARPLTPVRDTMSGFFFLKKEVVQNVPLKIIGYKLGLEIMVKGNHQDQILEIPYIFQNRNQGDSKIGFSTYMAYLYQLFLLY